VRTVYLGTSAFAAAVLVRLSASPHRPALVVTRPDRPRGRGRQLGSPAVAQAAKELGLAIDQPEQVNSEAARARIAEATPDVICVCAFGALIKEPLLSEHELINVHPSLLPRWRGAAPVERALMAGDSQTGVSIIRLVAGLDSGPICLSQVEPIGARDTYGTLTERLQTLSGDLLVQALDTRPAFVDQNDAGVTYADKIGPADRLLDATNSSAPELDRVVRALHPHIGARAQLPDESFLTVQEAAVTAAHGPAERPERAGHVRAFEGRLLLDCREGVLELLVVQPPGGRPMAAGDYLRGRPLRA
jgi:methionyl-tRNA formyltransferase